jgi:RNA polymerase sigma-70 factor (ECF subfamily)
MPALRRWAIRICPDPWMADDALQQALITAWRRHDDFRLDGSWAAWVGGMIRRHAGQDRRRRRVHLALSSSLPSASAPSAHSDERIEAMRSYLALLTEADRSILVARHCDGRSLTEIAEADGRSPQAVAAHLHRARLRLLRLIGPSRLGRPAKIGRTAAAGRIRDRGVRPPSA